jgi:meromycolic acid enoyl-[acyl-carrier-protein] reductase
VRLSLGGKRVLVTGVLTEESIAWGIAKALQEAGADVVLTGYGRTKRITERAAAALPEPADVLEFDASSTDDHARLAERLTDRWSGLDGLVHAIAAAPVDAIGGGFLTTPPESAVQAFRTSAYSLQSLTGALLPLLAKGDHPAVVGLSFDSRAAWTGYDWMGVSKAALEAVCRYLALYLGPDRIRVNLVTAGPLETVSGRGVSTFEQIADHWEHGAPLGWDRTDVRPVVGPALFLLSELAAGITGEILHADGGMHAVGGSR